jgi:hypothetical protein
LKLEESRLFLARAEQLNKAADKDGFRQRRVHSWENHFEERLTLNAADENVPEEFGVASGAASLTRRRR